jgi:hypothetical protein
MRLSSTQEGKASRAMASTQLQPHLMSFVELADGENGYLEKLRFYQEVDASERSSHRLRICVFTKKKYVYKHFPPVCTPPQQLTILCNKGYVKNKLKFKEKMFWAYFACHDLIPYTEYLVQQLTLRKERALLGGEDVRLFDMDWQVLRIHSLVHVSAYIGKC